MVNIITGEGATRTPDFMLLLGQEKEKDITPNFSRRLISLTMTDNRGADADQLDIVLDDSDGQVELPVRGQVLWLYLGWKGSALLGKGRFIVDEVRHQGAPDKITVVARSVDFRQQFNTKRDGSWHNTTLGAVVETIAKRNDLQPRVAESLAAIPITHIDQTQESDSAFLTRLAVRNGGAVSVKLGRLFMIKAGSGINPDGNAFLQQVIRRSDGDSHVFTMADRSRYSGVQAKWLDINAPKQPNQVKVATKQTAQSATAQTHPDAKPTTAASQKAQEDGSNSILKGEPGKVLTLNTVFASQEQAKQAAEASWSQLQRGVNEFSITLAVGREALSPEMPVQVSGFKKAIDDQQWIISKVTHSLDAKGFMTKLDLEAFISGMEYEVEEKME